MKIPKNISQWIAEIVILFLGVTLAFLTEDYRTKREERENLTKHLLRIKSDLQKDSLTVNSYLAYIATTIRTIDSLEKEVVTNGKIRDKLLLISFLGQSSLIDTQANGFDWLRNSGTYSSLENPQIANYLRTYYKHVDLLLEVHNDHLKWMNGPYLEFVRKNLHPADNKFFISNDMKGFSFGTWANESSYKSNLDAFNEIIVLNLSKEKKAFYQIMQMIIKTIILPTGSSLKSEINTVAK